MLHAPPNVLECIENAYSASAHQDNVVSNLDENSCVVRTDKQPIFSAPYPWFQML